MRSRDVPNKLAADGPEESAEKHGLIDGVRHDQPLHCTVAQGANEAIRLLGYTALYVGDDIVTDLRDIESKAARNNPTSGITGVLLFDAGRFVQVIEGPEASIDRLFARISCDPRGAGMHVLFDTHVHRRSMREWALWVGRLDHTPPFAISELDRFRDMYERSFRLDADGFMTLLLQLIKAARRCSEDASDDIKHD